MYNKMSDAYYAFLLDANYVSNDVVRSQWTIKLSTDQDLVYDRTRDYLQEVCQMAAKEEKRNGNLDRDVDWHRNFFKSMYFDNPKYTPQYIHESLHKNWFLVHKYEQFKKELLNKNNQKDDGLYYLWLTFNFSPTISVARMVSEIDLIKNHRMFDKCKLTYCYEYYTENGFHPHCHMLVELNRTGTLPGATVNQNVMKVTSRKGILAIDYKMKDATKYEKRAQPRSHYHAYLSGNKIEDKQKSVEKDKVWRNENNLEPVYVHECV